MTKPAGKVKLTKAQRHILKNMNVGGFITRRTAQEHPYYDIWENSWSDWCEVDRYLDGRTVRSLLRKRMIRKVDSKLTETYRITPRGHRVEKESSK